MTQTEKNSHNNPSSRSLRPGQRQQERLIRQARRRRRRQVILAGTVAGILVLLGVLGIVQYQRQQADQLAAAQAQSNRDATATAQKLAPTQTVQAQGTATSVVQVTATAGAKATVAAVPTATAFAKAMQTATAGEPTPKAGPNTPPKIDGKTVTTPSGLQYIDIKEGPGAEVKNGDAVQVQYTGWLQKENKKFDSSYDRAGQPISVAPVGQAQVIKGWNEGLVGMKAGGTRRLIIPPALGYGEQGYPPTIPANSVLVFDVTVVTVN